MASHCLLTSQNSSISGIQHFCLFVGIGYFCVKRETAGVIFLLHAPGGESNFTGHCLDPRLPRVPVSARFLCLPCLLANVVDL
ncbi:hypothetical protein TB2_031590 [Malus domestica]